MKKQSRPLIRKYAARGIKRVNKNKLLVRKGCLTTDMFVHKLATTYGLEADRQRIEFFLGKLRGVKRVFVGKKPYLLIPESALEAYVEHYKGYSLEEVRELAKLKKSLRKANEELVRINSDQRLKGQNPAKWTTEQDAAQKEVYRLGGNINEMEKNLTVKAELKRLRY